MATLLSMLLMGSVEVASSDPDPKDDGAEPGEPQTTGLSDQDQFHPARVDPLTVNPEEFDPDPPETHLDTLTSPVRGGAANDSLIGHDGPDRIHGYDGTDTIAGQGGGMTTIYGGRTVKTYCAARAMILCTAMTAMVI